jgi:hypothetical protein
MIEAVMVADTGSEDHFCFITRRRKDRVDHKAADGRRGGAPMKALS